MTPVPNSMFDRYFAELKPTESIIMLIVFRQTIGWVDYVTKERKTRDWISFSQFHKKTGFSKATVSGAIQTLVEKQLLLVSGSDGRYLLTPSERCGKTKLFFEPFFK